MMKTSKKLVMVDVDSLEPLFDDSLEIELYKREGVEFKDYADSIKSIGQLTPVLITYDLGDGEKAHIISGRKRWEASKLANLKEIEAKVVSVENLNQAIIMYFEANVQIGDTKKPEHVIQLINAIKNGNDDTGEKISKKLEKYLKVSPRQAYIIRNMDNLIEPFKKLLSDKKISIKEAGSISALQQSTQEAIHRSFQEKGEGEDVKLKELIELNKTHEDKIKKLERKIKEKEERVKALESPGIEFVAKEKELKKLEADLEKAAEMKYQDETDELKEIIGNLNSDITALEGELADLKKTGAVSVNDVEHENLKENLTKSWKANIDKCIEDLRSQYRYAEQLITELGLNTAIEEEEFLNYFESIKKIIIKSHEYFLMSAGKIASANVIPEKQAKEKSEK